MFIRGFNRQLAAPMVGIWIRTFVKNHGRYGRVAPLSFPHTEQAQHSISGTGSAGMEASFCNFLEPAIQSSRGNGVVRRDGWNNAARCGAEVILVTVRMGNIVAPEAIESALNPGKK